MLKKYGIGIEGEAPAFFEFMINGQPPAGNNVVAVLKGGKPVWYEVADPILYRALSALDRPPMDWLTKWLGLPKRVRSGDRDADAGFHAGQYCAGHDHGRRDEPIRLPPSDRLAARHAPATDQRSDIQRLHRQWRRDSPAFSWTKSICAPSWRSSTPGRESITEPFSIRQTRCCRSSKPSQTPSR